MHRFFGARIVGFARVRPARLDLTQRLLGVRLDVDIGLIRAIAGVLQHFFQRLGQHSQIVIQRSLLSIRMSCHREISVVEKLSVPTL